MVWSGRGLDSTPAYVSIIAAKVALLPTALGGKIAMIASKLLYQITATALVALLTACAPSDNPKPADSSAVAPEQIPPLRKKTEVGPFAALPYAPAGSALQDPDPPLLDGLGNLSFSITTTQPPAQQYFDQGLRLTFAFNHLEARRAFRKAQRLDPDCAMCYWGEALVLGPNINAPMEAPAAMPAWQAIERARKAAGGVTPKERALIMALAARYTAENPADRSGLDQAYASAMAKVAATYPQDDQVAVLYAEALMDLSPWDYWADGGAQPKGQTGEIIAVLERVLQRNPAHAGAIHYYIHMVEASTTPERAVPYVDRLAQLMPAAGHLVHMPAHIYYRVGRYRDSIAANRRAVEADEQLFAAVGVQPGIYAGAYYPHNVHFLMVSAQMAGDGSTAVDAAQKLTRIISDDMAKTVPWVQPIKAAEYFTHAQFSTPETILRLPDPGTEIPYVRAMWMYAQGVAHALRGDYTAATQQAERIAHVAATSSFATLTASGVPATEILAIARHVLYGRIAQARGDHRRAIAEFTAAAGFQDRLPYMEPPFWYYPVRQSLAAAQLLAGDLDGAERNFQASLKQVPHNGWALFGLRRLYETRGDAQQVATIEQQIRQSWLGVPTGPALEQL